MPKIYQKKLVWLLCATILSVQPVFAEEEAKIELAAIVPATSAAQEKPDGFTLDDVIDRALNQSPRLQAFGSGIAAAKGEQRQAGAWANPDINYSKENVAGGSAYKTISPPQNSYGVSQLIEVGGKISARENIAGKGLEIASLEQQAAMLDIIRDVTVAYADAVAAQENVRLATEQKELAEDVLKSVSTRVGAAAAPLIQQSRAEVERSISAIAQDKAVRERNIALKNLAALMGEATPVLMLNHSAFYSLVKPESSALEDKLKSNPDLVKRSAALEQSQRRLDLEKANSIPDPRINVGMIDIPSASDQAFMVGVSLPIPVFNANRGNIEKARHEVSRTELDNKQITLNASAELIQAQERMENAYLQAQTLKTEILPSAEKAFRLAREGYGLGRFPYLEVLDAQRSLFGAKQQRIAALKDFHTAKASVERLTAAHMGMIQNKGEQNEE